MLTKWQPDTIHSRQIGCMWHSYHLLLLCSLASHNDKGYQKNAHNSIQSNNCWFTLFTFIEKSEHVPAVQVSVGGVALLGCSSTYKFMGGLCMHFCACFVLTCPNPTGDVKLHVRGRTGTLHPAMPAAKSIQFKACLKRKRGGIVTHARTLVLCSIHFSTGLMELENFGEEFIHR